MKSNDQVSPQTTTSLDDAPRSSIRRFERELAVGGAVETDEEPVGGLQAVIGIGAIVALFVWLATINIWYFVTAVGILVSVFLHELGHFATARWTGMKATQFFIGFGPRLWSFRRGETEYGVRALPLGAFVRIIGMNREDPVDPADLDRAYRVKSFPRRLLVISAGSIMHILIAISLLFSVYLVDGRPDPVPGAQVSEPSESNPYPVNGAALQADIRPGDVIVSIDGKAIPDQNSISPTVRSHRAGETVIFEVLRGGPTEELGATRLSIPVSLGASYDAEDRILEVNRRATADDEAVAGIVDQIGDGSDVTLTIAPADAPSTTRYVPAVVEVDANGDHTLQPVALAGLSTRSNLVEHSLGIPGAARYAVTDVFPAGWSMAKGVLNVFNPVNIWSHLNATTNDFSTRPTTLVGVGATSADVGAELGLMGVLFLLAMLNVFIGVFNMFPLLPLDGGHAAVAVYERVREFFSGGKRYYADVSKLMPLTVGVVLVLGMMFASGLYLDVSRPL